MSQLFSTIPTRANADKILAGWFNVLRLAGLTFEQFVGAGFIPETQVTIANNQGAASSITGLIIDKTLYKSATVSYELRRVTATNEMVALGTLTLLYRDIAAAWDVTDQSVGDYHGVTFSITGTGQVQYVSDNLSGGSYVGTIKFKAVTFNA